jgi:hypothetical protein
MNRCGGLKSVIGRYISVFLITSLLKIKSICEKLQDYYNIIIKLLTITIKLKLLYFPVSHTPCIIHLSLVACQFLALFSYLGKNKRTLMSSPCCLSVYPSSKF